MAALSSNIQRPREEAAANAALIAAAPELLEAAKALAEFWKHGSPVHAGAHVAEDMLAAIAKAESA